MQQPYLIEQAFDLTLFGMGFVFVFLALLVLVTKTMSSVIQRVNMRLEASAPTLEDEIDEEAKFVIEQAIKMHRGA